MQNVFDLRPQHLKVATVYTFQLKKSETAAMKKADVLASIKYAILNYPEFAGLDEKDFTLISPAPEGQVFTKPLVILMYTKTPEQMKSFLKLVRFIEGNEVALRMKFKVKFLTQKTDVVNIKLFSGVGDLAELLGVESTIE